MSLRQNPYISEQDLRELHDDAYRWALFCCDYDSMLAQDAMQDTYLKIVEGKARFDRQSKLGTWLFGVIRLTTLEHRRKSKRHQFETVEQEPSTVLDSDDHIQLRVALALNKLSLTQRTIVYLAFYKDLTLTEVSAILGTSLGTVRQQYHRAKVRLRHILGEQENYERSDRTKARSLL